MDKNIAVDDSLTTLKRALESRGYSVTHMGDTKMHAIVVNGIDDNFVGMEDVIYNVPMVNAQGKTPEEVISELEAKL